MMNFMILFATLGCITKSARILDVPSLLLAETFIATVTHTNEGFQTNLNRLIDANSQLETEESTNVEAANIRAEKAKHELSEMEKRLKKATDKLTEAEKANKEATQKLKRTLLRGNIIGNN